MRYWYDGTFSGVLTAVFDAFAQREDPEILQEGQGEQMSLDGAERTIRTDPVKADRVWKGVEKRMSVHALQLFYSAWLGECPEVPSLILHTMREGMRRGEAVLGMLQDARIRRLTELYRKVTHEVHFFTGTLRFVRSPSGFFHAVYEPDGNITELLAPHFAERFSCETFLIHDLKRGCCAVYDGREIVLAQAPPQLSAPTRDADNDYEGLWMKYFTTIAVEGRKNAALQKRFLPKRYWRHLTEMQDGIDEHAFPFPRVRS